MDSMLSSGTWKNLRFFLRFCSLRERDPVMNLICSTCHPWRCNVAPRSLRRDSYWFSSWDRVRMRYWSVTLLFLVWMPKCKRWPLLFDVTFFGLNSKMQKIPVFVSVGGRSTMSSGLNRQNLVFVIVCLFWSSFMISVRLEWGYDSFHGPSLCSI